MTQAKDILELLGRVRELEDWRATLVTEYALTRGELQSNTLLTQRAVEAIDRVERSTQDIVLAVASAKELWDFIKRWGARFRRWTFFTAKWVSVVAGAYVAVTAAIKGSETNLWDLIRGWWNK